MRGRHREEQCKANRHEHIQEGISQSRPQSYIMNS